MNQITIDGKTYTLVPVEETQPAAEPLICTLDGYAYYLGPKADEQMPWKDAIEWAASLGEGYELPSRQLLLLCYGNCHVRGEFKDAWYWSSSVSEFNSGVACVQNFGGGGQINVNKYDNNAVRAVRKVKVAQ